MLNIGIIGPGRVAERHAAALNMISNARLWSISGRNLDSAKAFAEKYNAYSKAYDDFQQMLNDSELHAVIIATPDNLHAEQIILAANAGKLVLVEKPVCTSIESCSEIVAAIEKNSVRLAVGYHLRWHHGFRLVATKAHNNELGKIHSLRLRWAVDFIGHAKWRLDPNYGKWCCLSVLGTHLIDLARWILVPVCGEIINQTSTVTYRANTTIDETVSISLEFESGTTAEIFCSVVAEEPLTLEVLAENSNVHGTNLAGPEDDRVIFIGDKVFNFSKTNLYIEQLDNFIHSIIENKPFEVSLEEGINNVKCLLNI